MRDEDDGLVQLGLEAQELVLEAHAGDRIDRAERLVHEQHRRIGGERAGDTDPLALTAGELRRIPVAEHIGLETDGREQLVDAGVDTPVVPTEQAGHGRDVARDRLVGNRPTCWIT